MNVEIPTETRELLAKNPSAEDIQVAANIIAGGEVRRSASRAIQKYMDTNPGYSYGDPALDVLYEVLNHGQRLQWKDA